MSKKTVCVIALLIANLLLLAHGAISHHHHEDATICFFLHNDNRDEQNHRHHDSQNCEHEEAPSSDKCCIIDIVYRPSDDNLTSVCRLHADCYCVQDIYALISDGFNISDIVDNAKPYFRRKPDAPLFYLGFISQSSGLRAPPVC